MRTTPLLTAAIEWGRLCSQPSVRHHYQIYGTNDPFIGHAVGSVCDDIPGLVRCPLRSCNKSAGHGADIRERRATTEAFLTSLAPLRKYSQCLVAICGSISWKPRTTLHCLKLTNATEFKKLDQIPLSALVRRNHVSLWSATAHPGTSLANPCQGLCFCASFSITVATLLLL